MEGVFFNRWTKVEKGRNCGIEDGEITAEQAYGFCDASRILSRSVKVINITGTKLIAPLS